MAAQQLDVKISLTENVCMWCVQNAITFSSPAHWIHGMRAFIDIDCGSQMKTRMMSERERDKEKQHSAHLQFHTNTNSMVHRREKELLKNSKKKKFTKKTWRNYRSENENQPRYCSNNRISYLMLKLHSDTWAALTQIVRMNLGFLDCLNLSIWYILIELLYGWAIKYKHCCFFKQMIETILVSYSNSNNRNWRKWCTHNFKTLTGHTHGTIGSFY